jgi:hypothetical protein
MIAQGVSRPGVGNYKINIRKGGIDPLGLLNRIGERIVDDPLINDKTGTE